MAKSVNKYIDKSKLKFFNYEGDLNRKTMFFVFPTIIVTPQKLLSWDIRVFSILIAWGPAFIQLNWNKVIRNLNSELYKSTLSDLVNILKHEGMKSTSSKELVDFLNKNPQIVTLLKNSNHNHLYVKTIIASFFNNLSFIQKTEE